MISVDSPRPWTSKNHGLFLAFEGIDGAGKTTQARLLAEHLAKNQEAFYFKEPSEGPTGKRLRELSKQGQKKRDPHSELALFLEDRTWDLKENIRPSLEKGAVILDRYILSNAAYQGALGVISPQTILEANKDFPWPEMTFLIELEVSAALERIGSRGQIDPLFEDETYLRQVKKVYDTLDCPGLIRLNGALPRETIFGQIIDKLSEFSDKIKI